MKILLIITILIMLMAGSVYATYETWIGLNEVEISFNGKVAMTIGVIVTIFLGTGLMFLVFYSSRNGYDSDSHFTNSKSDMTKRKY